LQPANHTNFAAPPAPAYQLPPPQQKTFPNQGSSDVMGLLEKLGQLRDSGILTPEEFANKKTELLNRL
jgi:hypothetical protein